ncbi:MAG TPA: MEDS domain-containing protein, partial [Methanosarcina sp.]|nr:MEDS domain-containing protein [Methanosarcina sp.]
MNEKLRKSGIDIIEDLPWGTHFCQFYQSKEDLMEILIPYFKAGLEYNELCILVTSHSQEVNEAKEALRKTIPDFDVYLENGQIEIIPYIDWYVKESIFISERVLNSWVEKLNEAQKNGYKGVRFSWNTSRLKRGNLGNFADYEKKVDAITGNHHIIALCTYSFDEHDVTEAIDIAANHQFTLVKKEGKWKRIESSGRKNLAESQRTEEVLPQNEQRIRLKPESLLSPDGEKV